jgi:hypothetical protein
MFSYNPRAAYSQYNGMGITPQYLNPAVLRIGTQSSGTGIPLWVWIAGGAMVASAGYYFLVYKR